MKTITTNITESKQVTQHYSTKSPNGAKRTGSIYKTNNVVRTMQSLENIENKIMNISFRAQRSTDQAHQRKAKR